MQNSTSLLGSARRRLTGPRALFSVLRAQKNGPARSRRVRSGCAALFRCVRGGCRRNAHYSVFLYKARLFCLLFYFLFTLIIGKARGSVNVFSKLYIDLTLQEPPFSWYTKHRKRNSKRKERLRVKNTFSHTICVFAAASKAAIGFADRHKK